MPSDLVVRFPSDGNPLEIPADLVVVGTKARAAAEEHGRTAAPAVRLLLTGDRDYFVAVGGELTAPKKKAIAAQVGQSVLVTFPQRKPVRRKLAAVYGLDSAPGAAAPRAATPVDLTSG